ncbi:MAG: hypothetical protein ABEK50_00790, partial [bacterium]
MATRPSRIDETIQLSEVLESRSLRTLFQPIVTLDGDSPEIFAVECLTRGPKDTQLASAKNLFDTAEKNDKLYE